MQKGETVIKISCLQRSEPETFFCFGRKTFRGVLWRKAVSREILPAGLAAQLEKNFLEEDEGEIDEFEREEKVGVLLLNLGGPETLDDVQPFLFNLFADPVSKPLYFLVFIAKGFGGKGIC